MPNKISARFAALLLILFFSCSRNPKNMVSYVKSFSEVIQTQQNLIFTFNHEMVGEEVLGKWDSTEYIRFTPKVAGRFRWATTKELVFSPATGFKPSTDYKAEVTKQVIKSAENKNLYIGKEFETLKFHTEYLQPQTVNVFWAKGKDGNGVVVRTGIVFNYEVEPAGLKELIKITIGGKEASFTVDNTQAAKEIYLTVNGSPFGKEQAIVEVKFLKGIKLAGGDYTTNQEYSLSSILPSRSELTITNVEGGFSDNIGFVRVFASQELQKEDIENMYSLEPAVTTKAELTENGLYITGDFIINRGYTITLKKQYMKGVLGGTLKEDSRHEVYFGEMPPSISFVNKKAIYLSKAGSRNIGINITNVPEVQVRIFKIYENNILAYMRGNRYQDYYYDDEDYYTDNGYTYNEDYGGLYSAEVMNRTIKTSDLPRVNGSTALNLDMPQIDNFKGIYLVRVASKTDYYLSANKLVSVSDIGLIVKQAPDGMFIFTNSILTAKPMADVDIHIVSKNNQDVIQAKTDGKGMAFISNLKEKLKHFTPAMITARSGEDFNYLLLDETGVETSRFDVSGKRDHSTGLDVFIYGDRNIYRPGERVNFNAIVRNNQWEVVNDMPLKVKILLPNGKEYASIRKNTNKQGSVDGSFDISASAVTGNYIIEVYNGSDVLLASKDISIEEFMPDRIKATVTTDKPSYQLGEKIKAAVEAVNYFGPPAANRNYEMEFNLTRKEFSPEKFSEYSFYISTKQSFNTDLRQGTTDAAGMGKEEFTLDAEYKDMGVLQGNLFVTVFDESGRPVNRVKRFDIFTQPVMYGIHLEEYYVKTNGAMQIKLAAVKQDGTGARNATAVVELVRMEWQSVLTRNNSNYYYTSKKVDKLVTTRTINFGNGETLFSFAPPVSGEYEIRVRRPGADRYTSAEFYAYSWGNTLSSSFDVNTEGAVDIVFDKPKYEVGDKAKVLFKAPFTGKMLVTLERNGIIEHRVIETDKKSAEIEIPVKEEYLPNVYVSATLIKPLENSNIPLMVAHGYNSLNVYKENTILPVEIKAVEKSRSATKQKITVKTRAEAGIQVTLAVVDEGILSIKGFKTPDPHGYFYARRALEVSSHDLYPFLFPELNGRSSSGGDGYDLEKRVNPLSNNRVKLVSLWSGVLTTNSNGEVTYEIDIPKFSGDLRIMAVAYKNKAFGSGAKNMKVADPLVVTTGLPRFFSPGDEIEMPVNISNTTTKNATATAQVTISGPVQVVGSTSTPVTITANKENRVVFKLKALPQIGHSKITVSVNGLGEKFTDETEITVRPSTSLLKTATSGIMKSGESKTLEMEADFIPSSIENRLVISKNPMTEFIDKFDYLLGYPHGCVEQTVSKAFPQLYYADFIKGMRKGKVWVVSAGENEFNPSYNVREAIRKLQGMQMYNGAMSYWQGGYDESWWGSVFAAHFLLEAKKAGYDVDNNVLERLLDYVNYKTGSKKTETYYYYEGNTRVGHEYASREIIYSLYVLASGGRPNRSLMNYYKANTRLLTYDAKYMLAAAFSLTADRKAAAEIIPASYVEAGSIKATGSSFYSPIRNLALSLHALVETDINNPQVPQMAHNLSVQLKNNRYLSTQELVFSFLAMGKLAKEANKSNVNAVVKVNGQVVGNFANNDLVLDNDKLKGQKVSIEAGGSGTLYYFYETEGLSATGRYEQVDNFLRVRKEFFDRFGNRLSGNTFKQNDLIVVRISISSLQNMDIDNVVITNMLPAGFEIENPRITEGRDYEWTEKDRAYIRHFDVRDDRINFYLDPTYREQYLYYTVRAVTKGTYIMGPVSADAMYNGEYRSYNGAGTIVVQ